MRYTLLLLLSVAFCFAQEPDMEEALETFRFIRMAESRKALDFSDQKLMEVNALVDGYEQKKADNRRNLLELQKKALQNPNEKEAQELLNQILVLRREGHTLDEKLTQELRDKLSAKETVQWFVFYEKLRRNMQNRVRKLQQSERPMPLRKPLRRNQ